MKVAIIGGRREHLDLIDKELIKLIEESDHYLFTVIGGYVGKIDCANPSLGQIWACYRGLPYQAKEYKDLASMMDGTSTASDYIIFLNDGSQLIKRFIMNYMNKGKHGSVINI